LEEFFFMRRTPQFVVLALALTAASACSDSTAARLLAPDAASDAKSSGSAGSMTYTSASGVTATTYEGNTSGEGNSSCSALNLGPSGTKVDGAYSQSVGGYRFTVSSSKQSLSFAPIAGTTPTTLVRAVIVKGGPAYNVYRYPAGQTSDAGLTSPVNGGGNIPVISHYVVCYGPGVPTTFKKELVDVMMQEGSVMFTDPVWLATGNVVIPAGETRWLDYKITYTLPSGVTGTITENSEASVCATMGAADVNHPGDGKITCSFNWGMANPIGTLTGDVISWGNLTLSGSAILPIDVSSGGVFCGTRTLVNTATLKLSNGQTLTTSSSTPISFVRAGGLPCS
jgi:hypothetical protein